MAYKIIRQEFVRLRPKWLIRLLMNISSKTYDVCQSLEEVQMRLRFINKKILDIQLLEKYKSLQLKTSDDGLEITNLKGKVYVKFFINNNYTVI